MKRISILISIVLAAFSMNALAANITAIKAAETGGKVRFVVVMDALPKYKIERKNTSATIKIMNAKLQPNLRKSFSVKNLDSLTVSQDGGTCEVRAEYRYLTSVNISVLKKPYRLVAEFSKLSRMALPKEQSPEIQRVTTAATPDKFKITVAMTSLIPYTTSTTETGLIIEIPGMNSVLKNQKIATKDKLIPSITVNQSGKNTEIRIAQNYPAFYQIYKSDNPTALIIEFDRGSRTTLDHKEIKPGVRFFKMVKGTEDGPSTVNALIVDQSTNEVSPFIAVRRPEDPNMLGVIARVFTFWVPNDETKYYRETVSQMVKDAGAVGGVNGTYFGAQGEPLGAFMINGELISYSIHDRTALIIGKDNRCYIDNVSLYGEASVDGSAVPISGINTKRTTGDVIVFTPRFGGQTEEDEPSTILSVIGNEVRSISRTRGWIPSEGYAISIDPSYYEKIAGSIRVGSRVDLSLKLMPLSSIPGLEIKHLIGGGPRLLKAGVVYISKNSEKFKNDIANSRASRTAVGITKEGLLTFVTVDKCKQTAKTAKSAGATLEELAQIMRDLGCVDAMNLDGGGSSTMVIGEEIVNSPSNGREVTVSNSILVK